MCIRDRAGEGGQMGKIIYSIISNPVYGINTLGILIPASVWLFSSIAATIRGKASALPFSVCARRVCLSPFSLNLHFNRLAWNDSKFDTELTSSHRFCAADQTSKSYVRAEVKDMSPPQSFSMRYGSSSFETRPSTWFTISSSDS